MTYYSIIQPTDIRHVNCCVGGTTHISFCHFIASSCRPHRTVSLVRMASALPRSSCQCVSAIWQRIATPTITATFSNSSSQCQPPVSCGMRRRLLLALPFSTKAPAAKKGKKGGDEGGGSGAAETSVGDVSKVAPINIYKEGKDPPLLPDDQYPEWLFDIRPLTLPEYRKMDIAKLPLREQRRYWKLLNRQVIKEKNAAGQKL